MSLFGSRKKDDAAATQVPEVSGGKGWFSRLKSGLSRSSSKIGDGVATIFAGGEPRPRGWLPLPDDAFRITARHYFEEERCAAADPTRFVGGEEEPESGETAAEPATDEPVPDPIIRRILEAGRFAPSAGNKQPWRLPIT